MWAGRVWSVGGFGVDGLLVIGLKEREGGEFTTRAHEYGFGTYMGWVSLCAGYGGQIMGGLYEALSAGPRWCLDVLTSY